VGATASSHHAQCVLGVQVEMVFGQRPYVDKVVSWEAFPEFDTAFSMWYYLKMGRRATSRGSKS